MSSIDTRLPLKTGDSAISIDRESGQIAATAEVRGYGGWLALFCGVQIYLVPILTGLKLVGTLIAISVIVDHYPGLSLAAVIESVASVCLTVWGYQVAQALRALRPGAVQDVKALLRGKLAWAFAALFLPALTEMPGEVFVGAIRDLLVALVGFAIWYSYSAFRSGSGLHFQAETCGDATGSSQRVPFASGARNMFKLPFGEDRTILIPTFRVLIQCRANGRSRCGRLLIPTSSKERATVEPHF